MGDWFVSTDGLSEGPLSDEELLRRRDAGLLAHNTLLWRAGMPSWEPAESIVAASHSLAQVASSHVAGDPGPFYHVARSFKTPAGKWTGEVLASPRALYLIKERVLVEQGGVVKVAVELARASLELAHDPTATCHVVDLPPAVRAQIDPNGGLARHEVIVLPREAIHRVSIPTFDTGIKVRAGDARFLIYIKPFHNRGIRRFMTENGWTIGQTIEATASAVLRLGATPNNTVDSAMTPPPLPSDSPYVGGLERAARELPILRALYMLAAIAVIGLFIYAKWRTRHGR